MYGSWLSIAGAAGVVPRVLQRSSADGKPGLCASPRFRLYRDTSSRRIVVDHAVIVVPEHVLWGRWALEFEFGMVNDMLYFYWSTWSKLLFCFIMVRFAETACRPM